VLLSDLVDGVPDALIAHEAYEGERYVSADLGERDLSGVSLTECLFVDVGLTGVVMRGAALADVRIERMNAATLSMPRVTMRTVEIDGSRLGSAEFFDAQWDGVQVTNSKLGFVNLRGSRLQDVRFSGCTIDELDLGGVTADRVAFDSTTVNVLDVTRAAFTNVDLRGLEFRQINGFEGLAGATITADQLSDLLPVFAQHFGLVVD
jgi:uncharacterized protein YjbI with pentapeptide repeats